jgi:exopolyphosphatase/guanosine-5'-triphosphate,3'-diphosphate pyrophosphatase
MSRVAAIDIGTNTVRLLILDGAGGTLTRELAITRLGEGVDTSGVLAPAALDRTCTALAQFARSLQQHRPERLRVVATSAARDAGNRDDFFARVEQILGCKPELLAGQTEASLSFAGATLGRHQGGPSVVLDIGGGSTEFALGHREVQQALSLNIGSVRISERHLHHDPPSTQELAAAQAELAERLEAASGLARRLREPDWRGVEWIGVAGSVTTLAAFAQGLRRYQPEVTHGARLTAREVAEALQKLSALDTAARRPLLIEPKRAEAIVGGALVLQAVFSYFELNAITVSETDILDGLAASLLG